MKLFLQVHAANTLQELGICPELTLVSPPSGSVPCAELLKKVCERALGVSAESDPRVPMLPSTYSPFVPASKHSFDRL